MNCGDKPLKQDNSDRRTDAVRLLVSGFLAILPREHP